MSAVKLRLVMSALALLLGLSPTAAQDRLRIAAGLAGTWENSFSELGQNAGFFKKHGLELDIFYTAGAAGNHPAVVSRRAAIGTGVGTFNPFGAFIKGAPVRVIAATHTGANDLTWYVRADSPIKDHKDLAGKSVAYSTAGSSTFAALQGFQRVFGVTFKPVATGGPTAARTPGVSGQIDGRRASPPFAPGPMEGGQIRHLIGGRDAAGG